MDLLFEGFDFLVVEEDVDLFATGPLDVDFARIVATVEQNDLSVVRVASHPYEAWVAS